jgi:hypothetical protein
VVIGIVVVALIGGGVAAALLLGGNKPSSPSSSLPTPSTATPGDDPTPTPSEDPTTQAPPIDHSLIEARGDITPPPGWTLDQSATPSEPTLTYRHTRTGTAVLVRTDTNFRDWELSRYASSVLVKLAADYPGTTTNRVADGTVNGLEMLRYAAEKVVSSDKEYTVNLVFFRADLPEANIYRISLWVKTENVTELASDVEAIINSFHVVI